VLHFLDSNICFEVSISGMSSDYFVFNVYCYIQIWCVKLLLHTKRLSWDGHSAR